MDISESPEKSNWRIEPAPSSSKYQRIIINTTYPVDLLDVVYNYDVYTPIVLSPINKSQTFILSAFDDKGRLGLAIQDLRLVNGEIVSSINFMLRGNHHRLSKFKNEMNRVADSDRCVGISYFFRKLFYNGFNVFMAPRRFVKKTNSPLRDVIGILNTIMADNNTGCKEDDCE